jgi:hypothetical protein
MRKFKIIIPIITLLLLAAAVVSLDSLNIASAQGPCGPNIPLCGQRTPYTAGSGISINANNVISSVAGPGFPIVLGSTSIAQSSTTTTLAGLTLTGPAMTNPTIGAGSAITSSGPGGALGAVAFNAAVGITETCSVIPTGITIVGGIITAVTGGTCTP